MSPGRRRPPTVVSIASSKGGVGKTTIAANLACAISRATPTVLADFNAYSPDIEWALGLRPTYRLHDVARRLHEDPAGDIDAMLTTVDSRLSVLCGPDSHIAADGVSAADISVIHDRLMSLGRTVVVDCGPGMTDHTIDALEASSHIVVTTTTDVASVQAARKLLDSISLLNIDPARIHLVVNRATSRVGLRVADVESRLGRNASVLIPDSERITESMNSGQSIVDSQPRSRIADRIRSLADVILQPADVPGGDGR